jgi:hypothetical protein
MTPANALSESPSINGQCGTGTGTTAVPCATGQYVAFASVASNLGPNASNVQNGIENIFVRDTCNALSSTTICATYTLLASQPGGTAPPPANGDSFVPAVSGDGHTVSFISSADNLVARDTNAVADIFLAGANLTFNLTVTMAGTGSGTVTDNQSQINCVQTAATSTAPLTVTGTCTARYISGTSVTLTFQTWAGSVIGTNCTTTGTACTFTEIQDNTATATFQ